MEDKYFEDLFNEGSISFAEFLNQLDSYQPIRCFEDEPLASSPLVGGIQSELMYPPLLLSSSKPEFLDGSESSMSGNVKPETITHTESTGVTKIRPITRIEDENGSHEEKKQTRAEKNRKYAKESRERKKKYIETLEAEIRKLKCELEMVKSKYKGYEILENCRSAFHNGLNTSLANAYKEMHENKQSIADRKAFMISMNNSLRALLQDQKTAVKALGKILVDIVMPLPMRIFMWISENDIDITKPEEVARTLSPVVNLKHAQVVIDYTRQIDPEGLKEKELHEVMKKSLKVSKSALREIMSQVKIILNEFENRSIYMTNNILPYLTPYVIEILGSITMQLSAKSDIATLATNQLIDTLCDSKHIKGSPDVAKTSA